MVLRIEDKNWSEEVLAYLEIKYLDVPEEQRDLRTVSPTLA